MKKIFTLLCVLAISVGAYAQKADNGVELTRKNYKGIEQNGGDYWLTFTDTDLKLETGSGDQIVTGEKRVQWYNNVSWLDGWKVSKNDKVRLKIPEGLVLTKIEMFGFVYGSKWDYLYCYGEDEWGDPEWADPIGQGVRDPDDFTYITAEYIKNNAVYPIDPCGCNNAGYENETLACHEAGYTFASLDFSKNPYANEFSFVISGNNVICLGLRCWTSNPLIQGIKGDADDDGVVTVSDITTIAAYILGNNPSPFNESNADADEDGQITVSDITTTAGIILND
ncbi:MAG: dockerin type I repeat-containing protein [Prevotellaceae bacterium]|nr:dockerin type I repeat-containing protein [Prevotellaceae bacterium]